MTAGEAPPVPAYLISLPDGRVRHELAGHRRFVHAVAFRPDGKRLATLGDEGTIRVWDTGSGRELRAIRPGRLGYSSGGRCGAAAGARTAGGSPAPSEDGLVRIWDPETGRETARIDAERPIRGLEPGRDPDRLGPAMTRGWRSAPGMPGTSGCASPSSGNRAVSSALSWSPDSRRLAATSDR